MALQYSPKIVTDGLVMNLDASQNKSYPVIDLPVKDQLNLWLDAADDTVFSYSSGTTVSQWRDKSGQNNHAPVFGGSPVRSVAINSRKAVSFTATTSFRCLTGNFSSTATHFVVCRATSSGASYQRVYNGGSDSRIFIGALTNNIATFWGNQSGWIDVSANSPSITILNTLRIISAINNGSTGTPYYNGTAMSTKTTTNSGEYTGYELNSYSGGITAQALVGEVCEIIVYNKQLTDVERKLVHTYLGQKWGISNADRSLMDLGGLDDHALFGNGVVGDMPTFDYYNKGSLRFAGHYALCPTTTVNSLNGDTLTVETWIKHANFGVAGGQGRSYISNWHAFNTLNQRGFILRTYVDERYPRFWWCWGGGNNYDAFGPSSYVMNLDQIYHIVATYEKGVAVKIYINGRLEGTGTNSINNTIAFDTTNGVYLGFSNIDSSYFYGNMYVARLYNRVLTAAEVAQNYEAQKSRFANTIVQQGIILNLDASNPYSYSGAGVTWYDVSGSGNNSVLTNGPTYTTTNGGIINFDGTDDYSVGTVSSIPASCTVGIWIKSSSYNNKIPISIDENSYGSGPNLYFYSGLINWNTGDSAGNPFTNSSYPDSNWHYIVVTNDSSTNAK
jgi:hypothetical protein